METYDATLGILQYLTLAITLEIAVLKFDRRYITLIKDFSLYRRIHSQNLKMCHICCIAHGVKRND